MPTIIRRALPQHAFLNTYRDAGAYTDCFSMDLPWEASLADYVFAFYTSPVFKAERALLGVVLRTPARDDDARALALAEAASFSFWDVEQRCADQLLLRDRSGVTRSWLMAEPLENQGTRLYFGSAVVPRRRAADGTPSFGWLFHAGTAFHNKYTVALMGSARARLQAPPAVLSRS
ncbi:MAG: hypothetical protein ACLGI6_12620 [Gammaproteobacteria bacterium]